MTYLVTQPCCADASCVSACPVDSIHPKPNEPGFGQTDMLFINPDICIECGACVDACPVDAIRHVSDIKPAQKRFIALNRSYYARQPAKKTLSAQVAKPIKREVLNGLSVAIVGSGPSAMFAAEYLAQHEGVKVDIYEKLAKPFGLIRYGLAPDHTNARQIIKQFERTLANAKVSIHLNTKLGEDISHEQLANTHSAVIYATGAFNAKPYDVEGADLANVFSAAEVVAWYNSHPTAPKLQALPNGKAAAIVGNGNVALDIARLLLLDSDDLSKVELEPEVKQALATSDYETVYLVGRSGPLAASFSYSELQAFLNMPNLRVEFDEVSKKAVIDALATASDDDLGFSQKVKLELFKEILELADKPATKRLVLMFNTDIKKISGNGLVQAVSVSTGTNDEKTLSDLPVDMVVTATGFKGDKFEGLPYETSRGVIPNQSGRVIDPASQEVAVGNYVVGWAKRGPSGVIGSNRPCSLETVESIIADFKAGLLAKA